ncbi:MAG: LptF/LptG family permease [Spirochaetes bacterium]|nr:LptF/LptG family permease [Spirochaetota bacterium]
MILDRYLLRQFFPIFFIAWGMFVFVLSLIDIFANLVRYLNNEVPFSMIMRISLYYLPQCISFAMPISLLFAAAYTLGDLYTRNELTSVFASGIPFARFSFTLVGIGLIASVFAFFFDDIVVIPTLSVKNELQRTALRQFQTEHNSDIVVKTRDGQLIYSVDFYDHHSRILNGLSIIELNPAGGLVSHVRASYAIWNGDYWALNNAVIYRFEGDIMRIAAFSGSGDFREEPDTFRRSAVNVAELRAMDARLLVEDLRNAGLPYSNALANFHHRFSFSAVPLIVMILSISMGGRFRKNILLMSLFASLSAAVIFYVMEMLSMTMAGLGIIPPVAGAWFPIGAFFLIGLLLLKGAKT